MKLILALVLLVPLMARAAPAVCAAGMPESSIFLDGARDFKDALQQTQLEIIKSRAKADWALGRVQLLKKGKDQQEAISAVRETLAGLDLADQKLAKAKFNFENSLYLIRRCSAK